MGSFFQQLWTNRKKRVKQIGVPNCNQICCPKLDGVIKAQPTDAIKADGCLSQPQQLWLDDIAPLAVILGSAEAGKLMNKKAVASTQAALYLMGNFSPANGPRKAQEAVTQAESVP